MRFHHCVSLTIIYFDDPLSLQTVVIFFFCRSYHFGIEVRIVLHFIAPFFKDVKLSTWVAKGTTKSCLVKSLKSRLILVRDVSSLRVKSRSLRNPFYERLIVPLESDVECSPTMKTKLSHNGHSWENPPEGR